jgi:hypothetical protein
VVSARDETEHRTGTLERSPGRGPVAEIPTARGPAHVVPRPRPPEAAPALRALGLRLAGALLLVGTVTLVSCQALVSALAPGIYG